MKVYVLGQFQHDNESGDEKGIDVWGVYPTRAKAEAAAAMRPDLDAMTIEEHEYDSTEALLPSGHAFGPRFMASISMSTGEIDRRNPACMPYVRHATECEILSRPGVDGVTAFSPISVEHAVEACEAFRLRRIASSEAMKAQS